MYKNVFLQNLQCQLMHGITVQVFGHLSVCTQSYLLCHNAGWSRPLSSKLAYLDPDTQEKFSGASVSAELWLGPVWPEVQIRCFGFTLGSVGEQRCSIQWLSWISRWKQIPSFPEWKFIPPSPKESMRPTLKINPWCMGSLVQNHFMMFFKGAPSL